MQTRESYEEAWKQASFELGEASSSLFSIFALGEWQRHFLALSQVGTPIPLQIGWGPMATISNSLHTQFFISACRLREENRTRYSVPYLFECAQNLSLLSTSQQATVSTAISATASVYSKLKRVRGAQVAHLMQIAGALNSLNDQGVTKEQLLGYLQQIEDAFWCLGEPIGHNIPPQRVAALGQHTQAEMKKAIYILYPLPQLSA